MRGWLLFLGLVAGDFATKLAALEFLRPLGQVAVGSWGGVSFCLTFVVNTGAAWGMFSGHAGLLFALRCAIVMGVLVFAKKSWPIWLILAGAVGNGIDYCLYGHVIDFFHFNFWGYSFAIFNVADSCITVGALSLLLFSKKFRQLQSL